MSQSQYIPVADGDPLETSRKVLSAIWEIRALDAMIVPRWQNTSRRPEPTLVIAPEDLMGADPFAPVMAANSAKLAVDVLGDKGLDRVGIFLRPCELESLRVLVDQDGDSLQSAYLMSADCLGVLPEDDFRRHLTLTTNYESITRETLQYAAQGGILPSRYKESCQLCRHPYPQGCNLHLMLFGVETGKGIVVILSDETTAEGLSQRMQVYPVPDEIPERRRRVIQNLETWRGRSFGREDERFPDLKKTLNALAEHLVECNSCHAHLEAHCPLFDLASLRDAENIDLDSLGTWVQSCAGCGMCKHDCPQDYPLFSAIIQIRHALTGVRHPDH